MIAIFVNKRNKVTKFIPLTHFNPLKKDVKCENLILKDNDGKEIKVNEAWKDTDEVHTCKRGIYYVDCDEELEEGKYYSVKEQ